MKKNSIKNLLEEDKITRESGIEYWNDILNNTLPGIDSYFGDVLAMVMNKNGKTPLESQIEILASETSLDYFLGNYSKYSKKRLEELETFVNKHSIDVNSKEFKENLALKNEFASLLKAAFLNSPEELLGIANKVGLKTALSKSFVDHKTLCNTIIKIVKKFNMDVLSAKMILLNCCMIVRFNLDFQLEEALGDFKKVNVKGAVEEDALTRNVVQTRLELDKLQRRRKYQSTKSKKDGNKSNNSNDDTYEDTFDQLISGPNGDAVIHAIKQNTYQNNSGGYSMATYANYIIEIALSSNPESEEQLLVSLYDLFALIYPRRDFKLIVDPNEPSIILDDETIQDKYTVIKFKKDKVKSIAGRTNS